MLCGFWREPPRRPAFAGRLAVLFCVLCVLFAGSTAPASAYACATSSSGKARVAAEESCARSSIVRRHRGEADTMSFVFFMGVVVAIVLIPVAFGRREELPPE
jgi:drug/metabolite transporter (DMT)-like permease